LLESTPSTIQEGTGANVICDHFERVVIQVFGAGGLAAALIKS